MKKLAILAALGFSVPAFACPNMDHDNSSSTAKKDEAPKADKKSDDTAKATPAKTEKAAPAKDAKDAKKADKVSSK